MSTETSEGTFAMSPAFGRLKHIVVSGAVGLMKPDPRIFELTARHAGLEPGELLFVDDSRTNIDAAAACGFDVHHFTDPAALRPALATRGCCEGAGAPLGSPDFLSRQPFKSSRSMADDSPNIDTLGATAQGKLKSLIERIERLEEDKAAVANDLKEVYAEAKGEGFDTKIIRKVVRLRKADAAKRSEEEALIELYITAIGGL